MNLEFLVTPYAALLQNQVFYYIFVSATVLASYCWVRSLTTGNLSQIDRIWPIVPSVYAWVFVFTSIYYNNGVGRDRLILMATLISVWGVRLVYNYWRKGGYSDDSEDYRWAYVKRFFENKPAILYHIFNFSFIAFYQVYLLVALVLPMWQIQTSPRVDSINKFDLISAGLFVTLWLLEVLADQQQWYFQTKKYKWQREGNTGGNYSNQEIEDFKRGFLVRGLFKYTRHPNFFGEISLWWSIYLFSVSAQATSVKSLQDSSAWLSLFVNYSVIGAFLLNLLFLGSTTLTEHISVSKYPKYKEYQARVSRLVPFFSTYNPKSLD